MIAEGLLGRLRPRRAPARGRVAGANGRADGARGRAAAAGDRSSLRGRPLRGVLTSKRARRVALVVVVLAALLSGGWLWLRDSSLVAVEHVTVTGDSGPDAGQINSALVAAARTMTTLDVHLGRLRTAVAPYPVVRDIRVTTQLPHGMHIQVIEHIPVATIAVGGRTVPVAGDGTLLHDAGPTPALPMLELSSAPGGPRLTDPTAMGEVALLAAAPYALLAKISQVSHDGVHGFIAQVRNGPALYFGDSTQLAAKWRAVVAVLADSGSVGAAYIDVSDPRHPAAGVGTAAVAAAGLSGGGSATGAGTQSTAAGATDGSAGATDAGPQGTSATASGPG